jgi:tRNA U34 5-carboxymethylaminomethyl modifying GTPase MnmE/TrmE
MAAAVIGTLGMVTATSAINSITTLSSNIFTLVGYLRLTKSTYNKDIITILNKTDIEATIKLLQTIISEIPEYYNSSLSVVEALKNVQEIIGSIEDELKEIHKKITYNSNLYLLSSWRSYDCKNNLDSIEIKVSILDRRRDNLFKILEVFKNLEITQKK